jgi:hypothetical protein
VDQDRIWFKSHYGIEANQVGRDPAGLCASAILSPEAYHLDDAVHDVRAMTNPLVAGSLGLRFYAPAPLHTHQIIRRVSVSANCLAYVAIVPICAAGAKPEPNRPASVKGRAFHPSP